MPLQFIISQKGNKLLLHNGYLHTFYKEGVNKFIWRCYEYKTYKCTSCYTTTREEIVFSIQQIKACRFNLVNFWYRKIKSLSDLQKLYKNQSCTIAKWLPLCFGLAFLPSNEVEDAFLITKLNSRF
ncbi:unnamed protein product [Macrosiphum euphorbiae]|uniref:FLYWCH-type domain-containing protein n=1 Tax=Macrosiphum euphorbiae TaxID=13131 RepID=A0AAV0W7S9_9HEMI|nr:unnamed protein product [Macrosiphum euphorbiae]